MNRRTLAIGCTLLLLVLAQPAGAIGSLALGGDGLSVDLTEPVSGIIDVSLGDGDAGDDGNDPQPTPEPSAEPAPEPSTEPTAEPTPQATAPAESDPEACEDGGHATGPSSQTERQAHCAERSQHVPIADIADAVGASELQARGYTGRGIGVALIDTGVAPVPGLADADVRFGPDLSFESQHAPHRNFDTFGHGTHMASMIVGPGLAPDATLVSLKVAGHDGAVDVTQVIAAIDWVTQHADEHNIRVLNLSYGTQGEQDWQLDPLTHAVEQARRAGIVVVVAVGNEGFGSPAVNTPATHPGVIAVGASDLLGTVAADDDIVSTFSSHGTSSRRPDLVTPGTSVLGLRAPGSSLDEQNPQARVGDELFAGSGSSQAAALTSGAIALLLQARGELTPDQVKAALTQTATNMPGADPHGRGFGRLDIAAAAAASPPHGETGRTTTGTGTLDASRGGVHLQLDGVELRGPTTIFGTAWDAPRWAASSADHTSWDGGRFMADTWTGQCLCDGAWTGSSWSGSSWSGSSWSSSTWSGSSWAGSSWSGSSWSGSSWSGSSWSGSSWSGSSWSSRSWSGSSWSGSSWSGSSWSGSSWSGSSWSTGIWE